MKIEYIAGCIALIVLLCVWGLSMTAYTGCFLIFWAKSRLADMMDSIDRAFKHVTHL